MSAALTALVLQPVAAAIGYLLIEKRPGYGAYYGLARLTGAALDIGPVDWATLQRHRTPNDALVCPAGHCPHAPSDDVAKVYATPPAALLARLKMIALAEPDTRELPGAPESGARFLQQTKLMRFPDTIDVAVLPASANSTLAIYSRSLIGRRDFGVNRARIRRWLAALG